MLGVCIPVTAGAKGKRLMNAKNVVVSLMLLGGVLVATAASAQSLEEKEKWAKQDQYMADSIKNANEHCAIGDPKITNEFDKASFAKEDWQSHSPNAFCSTAFDNLRSLCSNTEGAKASVKEKIKKVVCRFGGKGKFGLALVNGTFTYTVDWDEKNVDEKITGFLKKNLASGTAGGESLQDKEKWARQDAYMTDHIKSANDACGITDKSKAITNGFDKASFANEDWTKHSPNGFCSSVFDDLRSLCANTPGAKDPVQKKIKRVACKYGGKGKFGVALSGGTLTYSVDWDETNVDEKITTFLKKNL